MSDERQPVERREILLLAGIAVFALAIRFLRLGSLSFSGDEETTTLAALALLDGWPPVLPGGLPYVRGVLFTVLESATIVLFGTGEAVLRWLPAAMGAPRVLAMWWLARPLLGGRLALAAAFVLAIAPLDVELSRTARMYSLFAAFDLVFLATLVQLSLGRRVLATSLVSGSVAVCTHIIAVAHAPVAWICALGPGLSRRMRVALGLTGGVMFVGFVMMKRIGDLAYAGAGLSHGSGPRGPVWDHLTRLAEVLSPLSGTVLVGLAVLVALVPFGLALRQLETLAGRVLAVATFGAALLASPVLGLLGAAGLAFFERLNGLWRKMAWLVASAGIVCVSWVLASVLAQGALNAATVKQTAKLLLGLPAPNWFEFAAASPTFFLLFLAGIGVAAWVGAGSDRPSAWMALIGGAVMPFVMSGLIMRTGATRYGVHALAPMVVLALVAASRLSRHFVRDPRWATAAAMLLVAVAARPDQTARAVLRQHGPIGEPFAVLAVAPDHRSAGDFLRRHLAADEWVAAEDMLQMRYYVGRVDLWLRRTEDASAFLYPPRLGDLPRDIYTGARHVPDLDALFDLAARESVRSVWLVTSAEVEIDPRWYRTEATEHRLESWHEFAWFVAADGMTRVYYLQDGQPVPPRQSARMGVPG